MKYRKKLMTPIKFSAREKIHATSDFQEYARRINKTVNIGRVYVS